MTFRSPHLAVIIHNMEGGGMQRVTLNLITEFNRQRPDLSIDLVVAVSGGEFISQLPSAVNLVDLGATFDFRTKSLVQFVPKVRRYLKVHQPKTVLSCLPAFNFLTLLASLGLGKMTRFCLAEHSRPYDKWLSQEQETPQKSSGLLPKLAQPLMRLTYPRTQKIITVSQGIAEELSHTLKISHNAVKVIYNPVVDDSTFLQAEAPLEHPWLMPGQPPVFVSVGRLAKQKDYPSLIRAFAQLRQKYAAKLIILGEGDLRSQLEKHVQTLGLKADISLPGFVANPYAYMSRAKAFVLSSVWETFGMVLVEAMACGCPVIATDCDYGPREILEHGKYGALVPVRDVDALAAAMEKVLEGDRRDRADLIARSQEFTVEQAATQYLQTLEI